MAAHAHTHDGIDWTDRLLPMRRADEMNAEFIRPVAERLAGLLRPGATVVDIGPGTGGMSAALATVLSQRGSGSRVVLVDAVPELLDAAGEAVHRALSDAPNPVRVERLLVDAASEELATVLPEVDLVWASGVVHHLPDQRRGLERLAAALVPGGWLALGEGGLPGQCLPWDLGIGEPGLQARLIAARDTWFADMRAAMPGVVRLPVGWNRALTDAGLVDVSAFSYLVDHPAPASEQVRLSVVDWLTWVASVAAERLAEADREVITRLLDPDDVAYVGSRDDVFVLSASTVHLGRARPA